MQEPVELRSLRGGQTERLRCVDLMDRGRDPAQRKAACIGQPYQSTTATAGVRRPLDKTAFIFAAQGTGTEAREAIAASFQPLITEEEVRPRWVNIYSRWDIISGSLEYYDRKDRSNRNAVENIRDTKATTLLAAHVEYWRNDTLFETIVEALEAPPATAPR